MSSKPSSTGKDLLCGTVAGAGQLVSGHPFDTVKVKLQTQPGKYAGGRDAARKILAIHGPKGFFKGLSAPLVTVAGFNAVLFAARGNMERLLAHSDGSPLTVADHFLCGAGAGFAGAFVACPTELIKCRLQACSGAMPQPLVTAALPGLAVAGLGSGNIAIGSSGVSAVAADVRTPLQVIRQIVAAGGLCRLYTGMAPTLVREVGGSAAMFGTYEIAKQQLAHAQGVKPQELGQGTLLLAGGLAGISFWLAIYPFDTLKSKVQTDDLLRPRFSRGMLDCARQVCAERGMSSLYCGFQPALIRAFVANAVAFTLFEKTSAALG